MRKALLSPVLLLLLAGALTGCSRYYWSKPGASPEQFTQDNQACVQQAARTLPPGVASLEAAREYYRACLNSRGYVRDKQFPLTSDGAVLRGTYTSTSNLPRSMEFRRAGP